jgi:hypothetical protein
MYKRVLITKPLLDLKVSSWEISNFISGFFLAKLCAVKLANSANQESIRSVCAYIFEFGSPVIILLGCVVLQLFYTINKTKLLDGFDTDKTAKRSVEIRESLIHSTICFSVGFSLYVGCILVLSQYMVSVDQFKIILNGLLPFEYSLSICMCLIWGNIIKFTTHYKL